MPAVKFSSRRLPCLLLTAAPVYAGSRHAAVEDRHQRREVDVRFPDGLRPTGTPDDDSGPAPSMPYAPGNGGGDGGATQIFVLTGLVDGPYIGLTDRERGSDYA